METLSPGVTGRRYGAKPLEPLAVSPREACVLLNVGMTRLYQLMRNDELENYLDGGSRQIMMESIHRRVERLRTADPADKPHRRRPPRRKRTRGKTENDAPI